jgi:antagonist of KipI
MLKIISPGFQTTVQDAGRFHFAHLGVSPAGAADPVAFRLGNRLVENSEKTPSLEMTLLGGTFEFEDKRLVALTGADCDPTLDGQPMPMWTSIPVHAGQTLQCRAMKEGARTYLCIQGGISIRKVMESAATHLQTGIGGWHGRALQKGERLTLGQPPERGATLSLSVPKELRTYMQNRTRINITRAPQTDLFSPAALKTLTTASFVVSESSNRIGLRLKGEPILYKQKVELITEGVSLGAIQVPANGQPILLFVEHPTTGGYPKIANVASADLCKVGQLKPRDEVSFQFIDFNEAIRLYREQDRLLTDLSLSRERNS